MRPLLKVHIGGGFSLFRTKFHLPTYIFGNIVPHGRLSVSRRWARCDVDSSYTGNLIIVPTDETYKDTNQGFWLIESRATQVD